jgi:hypothetical protein
MPSTKQKMTTMEFPSDILGLIREFSLPRTKFVKEFNKAVDDLFANTKEHYSRTLMQDVYNMLSTNEAKKVLDSFIAYVEAAVAARNDEHLVYRVLMYEPRETEEQRTTWIEANAAVDASFELREKMLRNLRVVLYGELYVSQTEYY